MVGHAFRSVRLFEPDAACARPQWAQSVMAEFIPQNPSGSEVKLRSNARKWIWTAQRFAAPERGQSSHSARFPAPFYRRGPTAESQRSRATRRSPRASNDYMDACSSAASQKPRAPRLRCRPECQRDVRGLRDSRRTDTRLRFGPQVSRWVPAALGLIGVTVAPALLRAQTPPDVTGHDRLSHAGSLAFPAKPAGSEQTDLARTLDRRTVIRTVLSRNPGLHASQRRTEAAWLASQAESRLPPPEAEVSIWNVPVAKPYDVPGSQMIMVGVRQPIPAAGALALRAQAKESEADAESATFDERERELVREAGHAFVDYVEASAKVRAHRAHRQLADEILTAARVRYSSGGALTDVTRAEVESARITADIAIELAMIDAAKARLNGLMLRPTDAPLGKPAEEPEVSLGEPVAGILERVERRRPELRAIQARRAGKLAEAQATDREATWPAFSVGALYFAPTSTMPTHGYGVSFSSTLPWLWGRASSAARAEHSLAQAGDDEYQDTAARIRTEVATRAALVGVQTRRLGALRDTLLPASVRAFQAATSGYDSGRTDILTLIAARRSVVEVEIDIVDARAALQHAMVELDWAAGAPVRRAPLTEPPSERNEEQP